jgi:hypothetical protein
MARKLSSDSSGWRTLAEISRETRLSLYSIYGRGGGIGPLMSELKRRGLLELRVFSKERGRGGEVFRARIAYDRDGIKEYVLQKTREGK